MTGFAVTTFWGGDAFSGKVENGRYYLSSKGNKLTQVNPVIYDLNFAFAALNLGASPITFAAFFAIRKIKARLDELEQQENWSRQAV